MPPRGRRRGSGFSDHERTGSIDLCGRAAAGPVQPIDRWDDPRCLIESYFAERCYHEHDADTVVVAWLSILAAGIEPARAARSLVSRLRTIAPGRLSARQRRVLELLLHVSRCGHAPSEPSTTTRKMDS